jgi:uncharacterized protein with von Willebrand factor type A (vWA) domain
MRVRYSAWTGRTEPLGEAPSTQDVLDELADDLLEGSDVSSAIARLARRGLQGRAGLDELRRRLAAARADELERMGLDAPSQQLAEELGPIVEQERRAVDAAPGDDVRAQDRAFQLDALPDDPFGQVAALRGSPWYDEQAGAAFEELLERLRGDVAQATFGQLAEGLRNLDDDDVDRMRRMLGELNDLADRQARGEDVDDDYADFAERHRDALRGFGEDGPPERLDDLLEAIAQRMAAMSSLLASLDDDQRRELQGLMSGALGDLGLQWETDRLRETLRRRFGDRGWDQPLAGAPEAAPTASSMSGAVDWVERLAQMQDLERALGQRYPGARLEDVDVDAVAELVDEASAEDLRALREIERVLEQAGAVRREGGRMELTTRGLRRLGERMLTAVYRPGGGGPAGAHASTDVGGEGELVGTTRPLRFGDPFRLDVTRTVGNALRRRGTAPGDPARGVALHPDDFELAEAEQRVRVTTALLLDMSFSMPLRGNWGPAKRVALALQALVSSRFPSDRIITIGFSDYARRLGPRDLLVSGWERVYGTNMEHAFAMARREFERDPAAERQVIMITDGEPTAHLEGGHSVFSWPPAPRTLERTLVEGRRLQRSGATLNVFLLDHDPGAARFVERLVRQVRGRLFYPDLRDLGSVVVRDFLARRGA